MADGKYGTKAGRLRSAAAVQAHDQSTDDFIATLEARRANRTIDSRRYVIKSRSGDYFEHWESTKWETVKGFAHWTKDIEKAMGVRLDDLESIGWMDLVCGFSGVRLVQIDCRSAVATTTTL